MLERLDRGEGNTNTGTETETETETATDTDVDSGTSGASLAPGGGADRGLALLTVSLAFAVVVLVVMIGLIGSPVGDSAAPTVDDPDPTLPDRVETQLDEALVERVNTLNQTAVGQRAERLRDDSTDQEVQFQLREQLAEQELTELQSIRVRQVASDLLNREGQTGAASLVPKINETYTGTLIRGGMDDQGQAVALNKSSYTLVENSPHLVNDTALVVDRGTLPDSRSDAVTLTVVFEASDGSTETTEYGLFHNTSAGQNVIELEESYTFGGGGDDNVSVQATTATLDLSAGELRGAGTARGTVTDINSYDGIKRIELSDGVYAPGVDDGAFVGLSMVVGAAPGSGTPVSSHIGDLPDGVETQSVPLEASFDVLQATAEQSIATPMTLSAEYRAWDLGRTPFRLTGSTYDLRLGSDATYVPGDFHTLNPTGPGDAAPATQEFAFLPNDYNQSTYDYQVLRNDATGSTVDITGSVVAMRAYPFDKGTTEFVEDDDSFTLAPETCATGATGTSGCVEIDTTSRTYEPLQNVTPGGYITLEANVSTATGYTTIREEMQVVEPYYVDAGPVQSASLIPRYGQGWSVDETHALEMQLVETVDFPPTIYNVTTDPDTTFEIVDGKQFADISASGTALEPNTSAFTDRVAANVTVRATHDGWARDGYSHEFDLELVDPPAPIADVDLQFDVEGAIVNESAPADKRARQQQVFDMFSAAAGQQDITGPPIPVSGQGVVPVPVRLNVTFADGTSQLLSVDAVEGFGYDVTLDLDNQGINRTLNRSAMAAADASGGSLIDIPDDAAMPADFGILQTIDGELHYVAKQDTYTGSDDADRVGTLAGYDLFSFNNHLFNETALATPAQAASGSVESTGSYELLPADVTVNGTVELDGGGGATTTYESSARRPITPLSAETTISAEGGGFQINGGQPGDEELLLTSALLEYQLRLPNDPCGSCGAFYDPDNNRSATISLFNGVTFVDGYEGLNPEYDSFDSNGFVVGLVGDPRVVDGIFTGANNVKKGLDLDGGTVDEGEVTNVLDTTLTDDVEASICFNTCTENKEDPRNELDWREPSSTDGQPFIIGSGESVKLSHQFDECATGSAPSCKPNVTGIDKLTVEQGETLNLRMWDSAKLADQRPGDLRDGKAGVRSDTKCANDCTRSRQALADLTGTDNTATPSQWSQNLDRTSGGTNRDSFLAGEPKVADFEAEQVGTGFVEVETDAGAKVEIEVEVVPEDGGGGAG